MSAVLDIMESSKYKINVDTGTEVTALHNGLVSTTDAAGGISLIDQSWAVPDVVLLVGCFAVMGEERFVYG